MANVQRCAMGWKFLRHKYYKSLSVASDNVSDLSRYLSN